MNTKQLTILKSWLLVGTLDILSAFIYTFIKTGKPHITDILKFIASGVFGKTAFTGGVPMVLAGLLFHYFIAGIITVFFFRIYPRIPVASKNKMVAAIVYGLFIWVVMNLAVVPLSNVAPRTFTASGVLINMAILIICFGIPLSLLASSFYNRSNSK